MRLSAPPRLFLPVRQISHVCVCVCLLKTPPLPFLVRHTDREKRCLFSQFISCSCFVMQAQTRRAAVISTASSATTTARTRTR